MLTTEERISRLEAQMLVLTDSMRLLNESVTKTAKALESGNSALQAAGRVIHAHEQRLGLLEDAAMPNEGDPHANT